MERESRKNPKDSKRSTGSAVPDFGESVCRQVESNVCTLQDNVRPSLTSPVRQVHPNPLILTCDASSQSRRKLIMAPSTKLTTAAEVGLTNSTSLRRCKQGHSTIDPKVLCNPLFIAISAFQCPPRHHPAPRGKWVHCAQKGGPQTASGEFPQFEQLCQCYFLLSI